MGFYDESIYTMLRDKFSSIKTEQIEKFIIKNNITKIINEGSETGINATDADDGPRYFYGNQSTFRTQTADMATRLGYQVVNYLMNDSPVETYKTNFPDGPPLGVSYFPVGRAGASMAGTDYTGNITGKPAYRQWSKYIQNVATQVGYKFINFLGAEEG